MMSCPKMKSFVILTKNTKFSVGAAPVSVRETSFKRGRSSPDTVCNVCRWSDCLCGHPAAMSGLATVRYSAVVTFTSYCHRHRPSLLWQSKCRPLPMWQRVVGGLNVYVRVPPSPPAPSRFPTVGNSSCPPLCCFLVAIRNFSSVPVCISEIFRPASGVGRRFLPSSIGSSYSGSDLTPDISNKIVVCGLFVYWGERQHAYNVPAFPCQGL
jgi:hypothetical protein